MPPDHFFGDSHGKRKTKGRGFSPGPFSFRSLGAPYFFSSVGAAAGGAAGSVVGSRRALLK